MTMKEINEMMAKAAEQAQRNTENSRDEFKAEMEAASKLSPKQLMKKWGESI